MSLAVAVVSWVLVLTVLERHGFSGWERLAFSLGIAGLFVAEGMT
jgi:hypothetical protein